MTERSKSLIALDIAFPAGEPIPSDGIAYYRLPQHLKEFFEKCEVEHKIIGFEYEPGSWNFGVILQKKSDVKKN